jgi:hypothetical protein
MTRLNSYVAKSYLATFLPSRSIRAENDHILFPPTNAGHFLSSMVVPPIVSVVSPLTLLLRLECDRSTELEKNGNRDKEP